MRFDDIFAGVGELQPEPEKPSQESTGASSTKGDRQAVSEAVLCDVLSYIYPPSDEPNWQQILAEIKATPLKGFADGEAIALRWSRGELDRNGTESIPPGYTSDADVVAKYRSKTRQREAREAKGETIAGFGSLWRRALAAGMPEDKIGPELRHAFMADHERQQQAKAGPDNKAARRILTFAEMRQIPRPVPLIRGLLYKGENVAIVAMLKTTKTFVALDIALSAATGQPVFGNAEGLISENVGAVVFFSGEGHAGMPDRGDAWAAARLGAAGDHAIPFHYAPFVPNAKGDPDANMAEAMSVVSMVRASVGEQATVLVIVDTLARAIAGLDENDSATATAYLNLTERLRTELGCTILTMAHSTNKKGSGNNARAFKKDEDPDFRGSSGFAAGFDTTWTMLKAEYGTTARLRPRWSKNNELTALRTFYLKLRDVPLGGERRGAVLELTGQRAYDADWPADEKEEKKRAVAADDMEGYALIAPVAQALTDWGAWPDSRRGKSWTERLGPDIPGSGGMETDEVSSAMLYADHDPTQIEIEAMSKKLRQHAAAGKPLAQFIRARSGRGGLRWALPVAPPKNRDNDSMVWVGGSAVPPPHTLFPFSFPF